MEICYWYREVPKAPKYYCYVSYKKHKNNTSKSTCSSITAQ